MVLILTSCRKEENKKYCWQVVDLLGNDVSRICDKSEREMQELYPNACSYYKADELFCWFVDGNMLIKDKSEDYINRYFKQCTGYNFTSAIKVDCNYCQKWYVRQKHTYKPTGYSTYTSVQYQLFCGDTLKKIYQGRQVILRETTDSLIIAQFSNNGFF